MVSFNFNETKTVEVLAYVAERWNGITPFFLSKVLFFADRDHLRTYGRPVTGDTYIAMPAGPVPSRVYDIVKDNLDLFGDPKAIVEAIRIDHNERFARVYSQRPPNLKMLSETDTAALDESMRFCRSRTVSDLSAITHQEAAWAKAPINGAMDVELLVPEDMREEIREVAAYTLL
ncbi:MAG: Panacea domain-containing protein [Alphaproteobacteria bacterium]|nr:Panacea domain-containing protein [Alphaproteobacteria bacterium]